MENQNDLTPAFFFVPDITGFTKFVATAELSFTKEVIPTLLRRLIDSNILKMSVAEIEGDAIFFYKTGRLPSVRQVAKQVKVVFETFWSFLETLEKNYPENHEKHLADDQLGLKIIIHYGLISPTNIKGRIKLLGEDVIIAHKLLKNSVNANNYVLLTQKYLSRIKNKAGLASWFNWEELVPGKEDYEYIGEVKYYYALFEKIEKMEVSLAGVTAQRKMP